MWRLKMANIYWSGKKAPKEDARKALMKEGVNVTDNAYIVCFESDDTGSHMVIKVERNPDGTSGIKERAPEKFMGWRLLHVSVPDDYIKYFYNPNGTKKVTKSADD
jgi:hypothetical protein